MVGNQKKDLETRLLKCEPVSLEDAEAPIQVEAIMSTSFYSSWSGCREGLGNSGKGDIVYL